jgi:hypothetical protein
MVVQEYWVVDCFNGEKAATPKTRSGISKGFLTYDGALEYAKQMMGNDPSLTHCTFLKAVEVAQRVSPQLEFVKTAPRVSPTLEPVETPQKPKQAPSASARRLPDGYGF